MAVGKDSWVICAVTRSLEAVLAMMAIIGMFFHVVGDRNRITRELDRCSFYKWVVGPQVLAEAPKAYVIGWEAGVSDLASCVFFFFFRCLFAGSWVWSDGLGCISVCSLFGLPSFRLSCVCLSCLL